VAGCGGPAQIPAGCQLRRLFPQLVEDNRTDDIVGPETLDDAKRSLHRRPGRLPSNLEKFTSQCRRASSSLLKGEAELAF